MILPCIFLRTLPILRLIVIDGRTFRNSPRPCKIRKILVRDLGENPNAASRLSRRARIAACMIFSACPCCVSDSPAASVGACVCVCLRPGFPPSTGVYERDIAGNQANYEEHCQPHPQAFSEMRTGAASISRSRCPRIASASWRMLPRR